MASAIKGHDAYFFLWTITDEGVRDPDKLLDTIRRASEMVRQSPHGECHLYVCFGEPYDLIGIATGMKISEMVEMQHAIDSFGTLKTTFVPTKEHSLQEYGRFIHQVNERRNPTRPAASRKRKR